MEIITEYPTAMHSEVVYPDSAYGSSAMDTDTEDGQTPSTSTFSYDEELMHKVIMLPFFFFFFKSNDLQQVRHSNDCAYYPTLMLMWN